jgi:hypothetical protein
LNSEICQGSPPIAPVGSFEIEEVKKQDGRDLTRFDLDYDLRERFSPNFRPPIYLTTRPGRRVNRK